MTRDWQEMARNLLVLAWLGCGNWNGATAQAAAPSVAQKLAARTFPSVFQAWNPADNLTSEDPLATMARHDLVFHSPDFFGLQWNARPIGLATDFQPATLAEARNKRAALLAKNPRLILIAEIRYRDAHRSFLPENHLWWKRDRDGKPVMGWEEGGYIQLDVANPAFQEHVAVQARAAVRSGVFDGVMLDWWMDDPDRLHLIRKVRQAIGPDALILANANDRQTPQTAPYINGYFMECYRSQTPEDWRRIAETLAWAETHLRKPRINCVETWYHTSRQDLALMRATTTLALTLSDGYCLFSDPNPLPTPDHLHDWYPFWNKSLGRPREPGRKYPDGSYRRRFQKGLAVYNPPGNGEVHLRFAEKRRSQATGQTVRAVTIAPGDGDLLLLSE